MRFLWCFYALIAMSYGAGIGTKVKRGIFGTVTSTVYQTIEKKHYIPASCVYVAPNIPDCRHVRFMNYPNFDANSFNLFNLGQNPSIQQNITKRADLPTEGPTKGWGEYLGLYRPTVTVTELRIHPTTVQDSRIMVTYDIRGCKPHHVPLELPKCNTEDSVEIVDIVPTTTVLTQVKPTVLTSSNVEEIEVQLPQATQPL